MAVEFVSAAPSTPGFPPGLFEEEFLYDIRVLLFENAAVGRLRIHRYGRRNYRAELIAETKGFVGFLTQYRKHHYVSEMEYIPERHRLLSRRFVKTVYRGEEVTRTITEVNYSKGEVRWSCFKNGEFSERGNEPIPKGVVYEDLLSAFFNLRIGAYGPLSRGKRLTLMVLPDYGEEREDPEEESDRVFKIRIADAGTERKYRERFGRAREKGLLVFAKVPKELFGQKTGEIRVWFNSVLIPVAATVEHAIFFGDVAGVLRKVFVERRTWPFDSPSRDQARRGGVLSSDELLAERPASEPAWKGKPRAVSGAGVKDLPEEGNED